LDELRQLRSEYIVRLIDSGQLQIRETKCPYAILNRVDGTDLRALRGTLREDELRRLLCETTRAIEALWARRVVHRDLNPSNIMKDQHGRFVVIDLGLAKFHDRTAVTAFGMTVGTLGYISPEQYSARRAITYKADLFSLGVLTYEVAIGRHPFGNRQDLLLTEELPHLSQVSSYSKELGDVLAKMVEKNPLRRLSSLASVYGLCEVI
jgi:serine/threonine protein kinase